MEKLATRNLKNKSLLIKAKERLDLGHVDLDLVDELVDALVETTLDSSRVVNDILPEPSGT